MTMTDTTAAQAREALNALGCRIPMELARTHGAVIRSYIERAERAEAENVRLIEERARFPDRPDDIGRMIGSHYENLKTAARSNEDAWRNAQARADSFAVDAQRYRWLRQQNWNESPLFVVAGGRSAVRLGSHCPSMDLLDAAIDAALAALPKEGK
jgi:hypothetical protein